MATKYLGSTSGLSILSSAGETRITSEYNSGVMFDDIKGAWLSSTDDTDLVGAELVTNGTFDTDTTGWTVNAAATGKATVVGGELVYSTPHDDYAEVKQLNKSTAGTTYAYSFDVVDNTGVNTTVFLQVGRTQIYAGSISSLSIGTHTGTIVASHTDGFSISVRTDGEITIDNVSVRLADPDRSVNANGLATYGTITKTAVATGADLMAYSGFSASNYLEQPYNSDLDFGTGDFHVMGWVKVPAGAYSTLVDRTDGSRANPYFRIGTSTLGQFNLYLNSGTPVVSATLPYLTTTFFVFVRDNGVAKLYVNGQLSDTAASTQDITNTAASLIVGYDSVANDGAWDLSGSLALFRIGATAPSADQIAQIYADELPLFQENAACTLYGGSDAVTAIANDDALGLLHVGTSAGRSVFDGFERKYNTTDAVSTTISVQGGLVGEK